MGVKRRWRRVRLFIAGSASITLTAGMTMAVAPAQAAVSDQEPTGEAEVEQQVRDELADSDTTVFWVYMREQADLSAASEITDRADQGWYVYDQLTETAAASQADLVSILEDAEVDYETFWIANTIRVAGDEQLLEQIAARPDVAEVTADRTYRLPEPEAGDDEQQINAVEWNIDRIQAPQVWDTFGVTGEDIVIGAIDSGALFDHPALVNQYRGNQGDGFDHDYNWWDPSSICGSPSLTPCDNNGHGTHVTGTMVGDDGGDNQIGVAPGATWIMAKGCETSDCSQSALLSSGQFILAPTDLQGENPNPELRPHIVNNSWGGGADTDPWYRPTVEAWVEAGIFPQFASGNPGSGCGLAGNPGNLPESYAAGAFDINDNLYVNSGRGPSAWGDDVIKPNIAAPGVNVRSAWNDGGYNAITGTSMASPHVAGTVALMWSAAPALLRDIENTRQLLDQTAEDTEDLACGGEPNNNNVWGEGKLDAFTAVQQSPLGTIGTLTGTVTDADAGTPIDDATITIAGEVDRQTTTADDGTYAIDLPVGDYSLTASAFGYQDRSADVTVTEDATTTQDFALEAVASVTISGTVTDGSGHGWPLYASVDVDDTSVSTFTDPLTGQYSLTLPANSTYTLEFEPEYPGYTSTTETIDVTDADVTVDTELEVSVDQCRSAPGYDLEQPQIAMVTSDPGSQFADYFDERGILVDFFSGADIDQITGYDVVLWGYNTSGSINGDEFLTFLDTTDSEGAGVMFLDHAFTTGNGIKTLSEYTGNPASVSTSTGATGQENLYEVTQEHPILDGFDVGDQIIHEPGLSAWVAWFDGYEGEGREVIADLGRTGDGILGSGIGVQERANNRHVLMSIHSSSTTRGPADWSDDSNTIFWNALGWSNPDESIECVPVEGGLVLGQVDDANTGDGVNDATVSSVGAPEESATSFATPDDPALGDGFYWLFSSLTGGQEFTASADSYQDDTRSVDVAGSAATEANFTLTAGQLEVDPAAVDAQVRLGQSAERTFTVTNTGTAPAEVELVESGGGFEILGGSGFDPTMPRLPADASIADLSTGESPSTGTTRELGDELAWGSSGLEAGQRVTPQPRSTTQDAVTITHSVSQDVVSLNSVACAVTGTGLTRENGYLRHFALDEFDINGDFDVTNVSFGIETINGPPHPVTVNLYTMTDPDGEFDYPNFDPIGTTDVTLDPQELTIVDVPVEGTAPAGSTLVVEVETPDMVDQGGGLFVGSNPDGETAPTYLRSQSCGIASPTPVEELLPGQNMHWVLNVTGQVSGDLPWLELDPTTTTLQPGDSTTVTVSMDSAATEQQQPGAYTAAVVVNNDTPYPVDPVGVTMNVTPPNNWGKITGTVTGIDCDDQEQALPGAVVQIDGNRDHITLFTDNDGTYNYWMHVNNNPLTIIVTAGGHIPQTRETSLQPRKETTENFTLHAICTTANNQPT
jgi:subtilisin family serine protease